LNPIHLSPTSLINSAVSTDCFLSFDPPVARLYSSVNPSGEFIVIVAAVYSRETNSSAYIKAQLTDKVSHAGTPTFFAEASFLKPSYTDRIRGGAGSVFGLANGALMSAFRLDDSFDILALSFTYKFRLQKDTRPCSFKYLSQTNRESPAPTESCISAAGLRDVEHVVGRVGDKTSSDGNPRVGFSADSTGGLQLELLEKWMHASFR